MTHTHINKARILGITGMAGLVLTLAGASQVGAEVKAKQAIETVTVPVRESAPADNTPRSTSNLRCWQDGRLLFEETDLNERALDKAGQIAVFDRNDDISQSRLFLIETGSATCLYKKV